jgi:hypothetical protein
VGLAGLRVSRVDPLRRTLLVVEQLTEVRGKLRSGPPKTRGFRVDALAEQIGERAEPGSDGGHTAVALAMGQGRLLEAIQERMAMPR